MHENGNPKAAVRLATDVVKPSAKAASQGRYSLTRRPVPLLAPPITQSP